MDLTDGEARNNSTVLKSHEEHRRQKMLQNDIPGDISNQFLVEYTDNQSNDENGEILME